MEDTQKSIEELVKENDSLFSEYQRISDEMAKEGKPWTELCDATEDIMMKIWMNKKRLRLLQNPSVVFGKKWKGKKYTLEEFKKLCEEHSLSDSDGVGNYATETAKSDVEVYPSDITEGMYRKDFTHVIWFKKQLA